MNKPTVTASRLALILLAAGSLAILGVGLTDASTTQKWFIHTTYFFLLATVLCWLGTYLHAARREDVRRETVVAWAKDNWPGLVIALAVTLVAWLAIEPALRILSDEADLVGTSKNLFASRTATFTVSGKNYYDSYWDVDVAVDRRPALFPFLVSLLHVVRGYDYRNVFRFNLMVLPAFVLVAYRLAKSLAGETFAIVASLLVVAHPILLISVRSGGFDFLTLFFALLVIKSLLDYVSARSPARLAILWMNLCLFAEIRYESALFIPPLVALLLLFKLVDWATVRPYAFVYALTPAFLTPRIWQAVLRGSVPEQEPGAVTFSLGNFTSNAGEYFRPILSPLNSYPSHAGLVLALGVAGCAWWVWSHHRSVFAPDPQNPRGRFPLLVITWMAVQAIVVFAYVWGRAQFPSAARLVMAIDTFFSFMAAWLLTRSLKGARPLVPILLGVGLLVIHLPIAGQHRMMNRLTQSRETATT
ncbi:MAG TPA: hypothetical protein VHU40_22480, partial [Polyangia bacterium]|nr:hypothetical protein [Polyangia bacterium]